MGMIVNSYILNTGPSEPAWSGAPGYIGSGAFTAVNGDTALDVPYPSDVKFHDILLLSVIGWENVSGSPSITTPAGWTLLSSGNIANNSSFLNATFWKRADGTETGSVAVAVGGSVGASSDAKFGMMSNYRGCLATGTPYEGLAATAALSTNPTGSAITTTGADRTAVNLICRIVIGTGIAPPAGWTEQIESSGSTPGSKQGDMAVHDKVVASASTEPVETTTAASARWRVVTLALLPR